MSYLERLLPKRERRTNHVYLASEELVFSSEAVDVDSNATIINDNLQLADAIGEFNRISKLKRPSTGKKLLENVLRSTQINLAFVKFDLTKWVNENAIDVRDFGSSPYLVVREDNVTDENLGELLNIFCNTAPMAQPQMIILPNSKGSRIESRLKYASSKVSVSWLDSKRTNMSIRRASPSLDEFLKLFDRGCFEAAARANVKQLISIGKNEFDIGMLAIRLAHNRARILTEERADVEPDIDALLRDVHRDLSIGISTDSESFLLIRALALLQKAYCCENASYLNEALAITSTLRHELGVAMCLRYAHFLDVHPVLESHMLSRAEQIFLSNDCTDLAIYCANNRLLAALSADGDRSDGFAQLVARIEIEAPAINRRGDIFYNLGVEHLLGGRLDAARATFQSIDESNSRALIVACARVGILAIDLLCERARDVDVALTILAYVSENVAPTNRWHITNLALNILMLFRTDQRKLEVVYQTAKRLIDLPNSTDVRDTFGENRRMASILGLDSYEGHGEIPGPFGEFFKKTGMTMPYFFIWS